MVFFFIPNRDKIKLSKSIIQRKMNFIPFIQYVALIKIPKKLFFLVQARIRQNQLIIPER